MELQSSLVTAVYSSSHKCFGLIAVKEGRSDKETKQEGEKEDKVSELDFP